MRSSRTLATALGFGSTVIAQSSIARTCPESDICYSLNIPQSTVQSNSQGDIYLQLSAPIQYQWVALGQGSRMSGSNIFVMYTSADGRNVTVSPRLGTGHVQPQHTTDAQVELLAGSGVADGMMTANVKCSNCNSWSGGTMDFTAESANWIHAYKTGDALNSDDLEENISQHQKYASFKWSLTDAQGGDNTNPFVAPAVADSPTASVGSSASATASTTTRPTSSGGDTGSSSDTTFLGASAPFGGNADYGDTLTTAHGTLASLAFVALFPAGAILIRVANFAGLVWLHAAIQTVGFLLFIAAFGLGIYIATQLSLLGSYHAIIGIVLFVVLFSQPVTGLLHHKMFKTHGGRGIFSFVHLGIGRVVILLGLINGGLGLMLADATTGEKTAYAVCAAVVGVMYIAAAAFGEVRMSKRKAAGSATFSESKKGHQQLGGAADEEEEEEDGIHMSQVPKAK